MMRNLFIMLHYKSIEDLQSDIYNTSLNSVGNIIRIVVEDINTEKYILYLKRHVFLWMRNIITTKRQDYFDGLIIKYYDNEFVFFRRIT